MSPSPRCSTPSAARRVVEIGALRGETTVKMLDDLGPDAELHVIDPVPDFDPAEHERAVPRPLRLPRGAQPRRAADAAADGRGPDRRRPQLVHRVPRAADAGRGRPRAPARRCRSWSCTTCCGRTAAATSTTPRSRSPRSSASPTSRRGMRPGTKKLLERGGLNPTMYNAVDRGRPAQRRDDRARRLRRRVRPPAARRRPADLLRPRDRRRGGAARPRARAGRGARPPRGRRRPAGAARGRGARSASGR